MTQNELDQKIKKYKLFLRRKYIMACGCGRSPTGECIGWHSLPEEEYQEKLAQWNLKNSKLEASDES